MLIFDIDKGCLVLTLLILVSLAKAIFTSENLFSVSEKEDISQLHVLWLKCNGFTYYFSEEQVLKIYIASVYVNFQRHIGISHIDLSLVRKFVHFQKLKLY